MVHADPVTPVAWPLFDLRVTAPRVTLRLPSEAELMRLAARAAGRLLAPAQAGFMSDWALLPSPLFERSMVQFHWRLRAAWTPAQWSLALGIYPSGQDEPVGGIDATATKFAHLRSVSTGWWLLPEWRGCGLGKEALAAMLHLVFDGLGAREARSIVHPDNAVSLVIGRGLGYQVDGMERTLAGDGQPIDALRLLLRRDDWATTARSNIAVSGLGACAELFGLSS